MISKTMQDAINAQINAEQYSAQLYLAMAGAMEAKSFQGLSKWLRVQAAEETGHAMKLLEFLLDRRGTLELQTIAAPPSEFGGPIELFDEILKHEEGVTAKINALYELAKSTKDHASEIRLQWFVTEQVEEESSVSLIVDRLHAVGDKGGAVWYLDKELGKRAKE